MGDEARLNPAERLASDVGRNEGDERRHGLAMPRDRDELSPFGFVHEARKARLGVLQLTLDMRQLRRVDFT